MPARLPAHRAQSIPIYTHAGAITAPSPAPSPAGCQDSFGGPRDRPPQHTTEHCCFVTVIKLLFPLSQSSWVLFCSVIKLFHLLGLLLNSSQDKAAGHASRDTGTDAHTGFIFTNKALCWSCCFSAQGLATPGQGPTRRTGHPAWGWWPREQREKGRMTLLQHCWNSQGWHM